MRSAGGLAAAVCEASAHDASVYSRPPQDRRAWSGAACSGWVGWPAEKWPRVVGSDAGVTEAALVPPPPPCPALPCPAQVHQDGPHGRLVC